MTKTLTIPQKGGGSREVAIVAEFSKTLAGKRLAFAVTRELDNEATPLVLTEVKSGMKVCDVSPLVGGIRDYGECKDDIARGKLCLSRIVSKYSEHRVAMTIARQHEAQP